MTVPVIQSKQWTENGSTGTSITLTAPTGIVAGDLLLIIQLDDYAATSPEGTYPAGWTILKRFGSTTSDSAIQVWWKKADGTETDVAITGLTTSYHGGWYMRITGADTEYPFTHWSNRAGASGTSPALYNDQYTDVADTLGFYVCVGDGADTNPKSTPSGWNEEDEQATSSGGTGFGATFGTKTVAGDVGSVSLTSNISDGWAMVGFGISPGIDGRGYARVVSSAGNYNTAAGTTIVLPLPETAYEGALCIYSVTTDDAVNSSSITLLSGWTIIGNETGSTTYDCHIETAYKFLDAADITAGEITVTHTSYFSAGATLHIEGVEITTLQFDDRTGTTQNPYLENITTDHDDSLLLGCLGYDGGDASFGVGSSGYTEIETQAHYNSSGAAMYVCRDIKATAGATGLIELSSNPDGWVSHHIVLPSNVNFKQPPVVATHNHNDNGTGATNFLTISEPTGIALGDLLIVAGHSDIAVDAETLTLSESGWTKFGQVGDSSYDIYTAAWWKIATATEVTDGDVTLNSTTSSYYVAGQYFRITGHDQFNPIADFDFSEDSGPSTMPILTAAGSNSLILCVSGGDGGDTYPHTWTGANKIIDDRTTTGSTGVGYTSAEASHFGGATGPTISVEDFGSDGTANFIVSINLSPLEFPAAWDRKCSLTVANGKVSGSANLADFPALITQDDLPDEVLDADGSTKPQADGYDLRFTSNEDGSGPLLHEIVHFTQHSTPAAATAEIWVKIPDLAYNTDTEIWCWWDASETLTTDPSAPRNLFADYEFVSHDGGITEVASGDYVGSNTGVVAATNNLGMTLAGAEYSAGAADRIDYGAFNPSDLGQNDWSLQAWARPTYPGGDMNGRMIFVHDTSPDEAMFLVHAEEGTTPTWYIVAGDASTTMTDEIYNAGASYSTWQYVTGTVDVSSGIPVPQDMFVNADVTDTSGIGGGSWGEGTHANDLWIGCRNDASTAADYEGRLGEVRIRRSIISADWHVTEYNNQSDDGTFWTAGTPRGANATQVETSNIASLSIDHVYTGYVFLQTAFPDNWFWRSTITIDAAKVSGAINLTDFPMMITADDLPADIFDTVASGLAAQDDGGDIRFTTDEAGTNQIPCEIVNFTKSGAGDTAEIWVKVPTLNYGTDTAIYIWWGTEQLKQTQPPLGHPRHSNHVWDDYWFVSHDAQTESTGNPALVPAGTGGTPVIGIAGTPGGAIDFAAVSNREWSWSADGGITLATGGWTLQAWAEKQGGTNDIIVDVKGSDQTDFMGLHVNNTNHTPSTNYRFAALTGSTDEVEPSIADNAGWAMLHGTIQSNVFGAFYFDGSDSTVITGLGTIAAGSQEHVISIGANNASSADFQGLIAEVRLRQDSLTAAWVQTEYNNQLNDTTFMSITDAENQQITSVPVSDSWSVSFSLESTANFLQTTVTDSVSMSLTELATIAGVMSRSDDLDLTVDSITALLSTTDVTDNLSITVDAITAILVTVAGIDDLDLSLTEAAVLFKFVQIVTTDNLDVSLSNLSELLILTFINVIDYLQVDFPDLDYTYAQVESQRENDNINPLFKFLFQAENAGMQIGDFNTLSGSSFGWDKVTAAAESALTFIEASDILTVSLAEVPALMNILAAADAIDVSVTEALVTALRSSRIDTLTLTIAEQTNNLLRSVVPDWLVVEVIGAALILVTFGLADDLDVSMDNLASILATLSRSDDLDVSLTYLRSIFGVVSASDDLDITISEVIAILSSTSVTDNLSLSLDETLAILNRFATSDILSVAIGDLAYLLWLTLEGFRWRSDDGTEATATWLEAQDTTINRETNVITRLRVILDTSSDAEALQLTLQYRRVGDPDWEWGDVT